jgi:hypothetical protein
MRKAGWISVAVAAALVGECIAVSGAVGQAAPAAAEATRPATQAGKALQPVSPLTQGESAVVTPGAIPAPVVPKGFDAKASREDVSRRSQFSTTYVNPDGSETWQSSGEPVNFQDAKGAWQTIDNRIIANPDGTLRNAANDWTATFGSLATSGVSVAVGNGSLGWQAIDGAADAKPSIETDGVSVRYRDVWPGVDVVYRVRSGAVEELIELKSPQAKSSLSFKLPGADVGRAAVDPKVTGQPGSVLSKGAVQVGMSPPFLRRQGPALAVGVEDGCDVSQGR